MLKAKKITDSLEDIISDFSNYTPKMVKYQLSQAVDEVKELESFVNDKKDLAEGVVL